ncbi:ATP-binding protein [Curtobacterium flaccumfaciens]|uniref:ATP-binding protein n=1 Tax=Curtobacterium flaccumfaciens TaxID=2035 RepID=UPI001BDED5DF|nr:ATP-binding protein [Curtobacterium flaccumfaciens]MBT1606554.1 ATP-binding protein [Curtobacterium flaccumfaciens pv. betae]MBT1656027.1 ATP-binding protein [Curtobacterium flaccumfaciens pv. betae]MCS0472766.1 ATP-binding protein [Curtobacterium flaccumfaciens pv. betae]MCS0475767.1 ATP-binding protein [Curtobacterium flaccumfaciens pv. betae]MCS0479668.1 ATP-binding protein [Curtobacterium flaccumfaciens pv. betae]
MQRIGQVGAFVKVVLGYKALYAVCTQVGASEVTSVVGEENPHAVAPVVDQPGFRWMRVTLFGEVVGTNFERGVGQYPTVGDEVHLVRETDLEGIYGGSDESVGKIPFGEVAGQAGVTARLDISALVSRHVAILGSTGAGKSNLVTVLLRRIAESQLPAARVLLIDPHGEYGTALGESHAKVFSAGPDGRHGQLRVPYWALSLSEFVTIAFGNLPDPALEYVGERVRSLKQQAALSNEFEISPESITADSPIPFSVRRLWYELHGLENATFQEMQVQDESTMSIPEDAGSAATLEAAIYPPAASGSAAPFANRVRRNISRQLALLRSRILDPRFGAVFADDLFEPELDGKCSGDLDALLVDWVGHDRPITAIDVSAVPTEVGPLLVGAILNIVYEALYWGLHLPVGGKNQPLLIVLDEAHRYVPAEEITLSRKVAERIAREGRKYGVGLALVSQRASDVAVGVLSQCGSTIALRCTNSADRRAVAATVSDDLGNLVAMLPSLRTGECLVVGEALQVPSRVRVYLAPERPTGDDPSMPAAWQSARPDPKYYGTLVKAWRTKRMEPLTDA